MPKASFNRHCSFRASPPPSLSSRCAILMRAMTMSLFHWLATHESDSHFTPHALFLARGDHIAAGEERKILRTAAALAQARHMLNCHADMRESIGLPHIERRYDNDRPGLFHDEHFGRIVTHSAEKRHILSSLLSLYRSSTLRPLPMARAI